MQNRTCPESILKLVSFHIQAHLNAFFQILEYFSQICLGPLARESPCIIKLILIIYVSTTFIINTQGYMFRPISRSSSGLHSRLSLVLCAHWDPNMFTLIEYIKLYTSALPLLLIHKATCFYPSFGHLQTYISD